MILRRKYDNHDFRDTVQMLTEKGSYREAIKNMLGRGVILYFKLDNLSLYGQNAAKSTEEE